MEDENVHLEKYRFQNLLIIRIRVYEHYVGYLKTYQQKNLIAAFNLLETCLEVIPDMKNKKIYFAKQGQIAWLVSYVFDNARGVKQIY